MALLNPEDINVPEVTKVIVASSSDQPETVYFNKDKLLADFKDDNFSDYYDMFDEDGKNIGSYKTIYNNPVMLEDSF